MNPFRALPSVDQLLSSLDGNSFSHTQRVAACRAILAKARIRIQQTGAAPTFNELLVDIEHYLHTAKTMSLRPVINATGVIIHTNLGRAPLSVDALAAMEAVARGYSTLEYDLEAGQRGKRDTHIETLIKQVTGAEAALVVNNNAAAVYLALLGLAVGKEVLLSRSELVEIGGGFRMPDVMSQSGATLVEVGTTNRTRLDDYARAMTPNTIFVMRVHSSNFKIIGFTESVPLADLAALAHAKQIFLLDDLGSGALLDTARYGLEHEPTVQESLAAGADLVTFSGDKLLGGPQAGLIVGRKTLIDKLKKHPLARAVRPDKLCLAGLAATLAHYRDGEAEQKIPVWRMIGMSSAEIEARVMSWQAVLGGEVIAAESMVGGGSLPGTTLSTRILALSVSNADDFVAALRRAGLPIIARIQEGRVCFDPRTVLPEQDADFITVVQTVKNQPILLLPLPTP